MEVICLEDKAFYELINKVVERIKDNLGAPEDEWISADEAMKMLHITSPTTLASIRNKGFITFTQVSKKIILHSRKSISDFLLKHAKSTF